MLKLSVAGVMPGIKPIKLFNNIKVKIAAKYGPKALPWAPITWFAKLYKYSVKNSKTPRTENLFVGITAASPVPKEARATRPSIIATNVASNSVATCM